MPQQSPKHLRTREDRVGRDDGVDRRQHATAKRLSLHRQQTAFVVGRAEPPSVRLALQHSVLGYQGIDHVLLVLVYPAGYGPDQEWPGSECAYDG